MGSPETASLPVAPANFRSLVRDPFVAALLVSAVVHILLALALRLFPGPATLEAPPEESIAVELIFSAALEPPPGEPVEKAPAAPPLPPPDLLASPEPMIRATRLLAEASLADPRNRLAREALRNLAGNERMEQLCGIEAMDQVHAWRSEFEPDRLVAYAMGATAVSGNTIRADGAAFRSRRRWYNLRFRCELTRDRRKVAAFDFQVGDAIPAELWEAHNLPPIE